MKVKLLGWAGIALVGVAVPWLLAARSTTTETAPADEESSQPAPVPRLDRRFYGQRPDGMRPDGMPHGRDGFGWSRDRSNLPATRPVTPDEKLAIDKFMMENSPKRWAKLKDISEERKNRLFSAVAVRYRAMEELKLSDPKLYEIRLKRLPVEDEIFAIGWDLKHGKSDNGEQLRKDLRKQIRALVDSRLAERRLRVQQMEARAAQESKQLKSDEANIDQLVENNMSAIEKAQHWPGNSELIPPGGPRPWGQGGGPEGRDSRNFAPPATEPAQ